MVVLFFLGLGLDEFLMSVLSIFKFCLLIKCLD